MSSASSAQPRPALAYAAWLDSLTRAGWDATPATERAAVTDALGRVSAESIVARWPSPRSDCSAMDGIAVAAAILPGNSPVGMVLAGRAPAGTAPAGTAPAATAESDAGAVTPPPGRRGGRHRRVESGASRDRSIARFFYFFLKTLARSEP